jgi:hypothetical protein
VTAYKPYIIRRLVQDPVAEALSFKSLSFIRSKNSKMPRTNLYINKVRKWIDTDLTELDLQKIPDSEGDKAGREVVLTAISNRCYKSGVKVQRAIIHKEISSFYMRHKMIKATTPYAETSRKTKGRFVEKDATFGVKTFPSRESRQQRYLMHSFLKEY